MQKIFVHWMFAAILVCGASVFTSCSSNDDNPTQPDLKDGGRTGWRTVPHELEDGADLCVAHPGLRQPVGLQYPHVEREGAGRREDRRQQGERHQYRRQHPSGAGLHHPLHHGQRLADEFRLDEKIYQEAYGKERYDRITADYSQDILGTWEGKVTSAEDEHTDGEMHRWEYKADGTYAYYNKVGTEWVANNDVLAEYFVDGTLLCTRWKKTADSEELREWWEITIENGVMKWTALRKKADGSTYTATFEMTKVK